MDSLGIVYATFRTYEHTCEPAFFNVPSKIKILVEDVEILNVINTCIDTMRTTSQHATCT